MTKEKMIQKQNRLQRAMDMVDRYLQINFKKSSDELRGARVRRILLEERWWIIKNSLKRMK